MISIDHVNEERLLMKQRKRFDEAVKLRNQSEFERAREILMQLHRNEPKSAVILTVLADVCWDMKHLDEAISFFQQASVLMPSSEITSVGLFHCLWEADRIDDAFAEMKRFLASYESDEYTRLLKDMNR